MIQTSSIHSSLRTHAPEQLAACVCWPTVDPWGHRVVSGAATAVSALQATTLACKGQKCEACGGPAEVCCKQSRSSTPPCEDGQTCAEGKCRPCGGEGLPCCEGNPGCEVGLNCAGATSGAAGECVRCGGLGQDCCDSAVREPCSQWGACSDGECVECGGLGQPCCRDVKGNNDLWDMCGRVGALPPS